MPTPLATMSNATFSTRHQAFCGRLAGKKTGGAPNFRFQITALVTAPSANMTLETGLGRGKASLMTKHSPSTPSNPFLFPFNKSQHYYVYSSSTRLSFVIVKQWATMRLNKPHRQYRESGNIPSMALLHSYLLACTCGRVHSDGLGENH